MEKEIWRTIPDFYKYEVSNLTRVRSKKTKQILKERTDRKGRNIIICLQRDKKSRNALLCRIMAKSFIPNPERKPNVNHIDGDPHNNRISNLEWCTQKENIYHSRHITRNGAIISLQKIKRLYTENPFCSLEEFVKLLSDNCN